MQFLLIIIYQQIFSQKKTKSYCDVI